MDFTSPSQLSDEFTSRDIIYWGYAALGTKPVMLIVLPLSQLLGGAAVSSHCYQLGLDCSSIYYK